MGLLDYLLDGLQGVVDETVSIVAPRESIEMNRLGMRILEATGARLYPTWKGNHYLPGPNTIHLNKAGHTRVGRFAKRMTDRDQSMEMSFYHELGHAFVEVFRIFEDEEANLIFGDFGAQSPGGLGVIRSSSRQKKDGFLTRYAMEHAEEDFADCFAYIVFNDKNIGDEIRDDLVREKLRYVQRAIKEHIR